MFCWFFFCSQVYNEEKRWKTKGPTYTALWGHFFATPRCNPQMTGRRGWHANSSPRFCVCDICQVWSFSLFVTSGLKLFYGIWLKTRNFKSCFLIFCCFICGSLVSWACHKSFLSFEACLRCGFAIATSLFYFLQMVPSSLPWSSYGFTHITPCPAKWLW